MSQPLFFSMLFIISLGQRSGKRLSITPFYNTAVAEPYHYRHLSIGGIGCSVTLLTLLPDR